MKKQKREHHNLAGLCVLDSQSNTATIHSADTMFARIMGYASPQALLAEHPRYDDLIHPEDRDAFWKAVSRAVADHAGCVEHRMVTADGRAIYVLTVTQRAFEYQPGQMRLRVISLETIDKIQADANGILDPLPCGVARYLYPAEHDAVRGRLQYANRYFYALLGHTKASFHAECQDQVYRMTTSEDRRRIDQLRLEAVKQQGQPMQITYPITKPDGTRAYLHTTLVYLGLFDGQQDIFTTYQDVTELQNTQQALKRQMDRITLLANATNERFIEYDAIQDRLTMLAHQSDETSKDVVLRSFLKDHRLQGNIHPDDMPAILQAFREALQEPTHGSIDVRTPIGGPSMPWCRIYYTSVAGVNGKVRRIVARVSNIDAEKKKELHLRELAERDALTQLYSRGAAEMLITTFLEHENEIRSNQKHVVMMIDLDNFKAINDHFSHAYGDVVLTDIATIIRDSFRASDVVGRLGGDEFVVLMKNVRSQETVTQVASRICTLIEKKYRSAVGDIGLSACIGIASYPEHGTTFQSLYHKADIANYEAKAGGKNSWRFYQEGDALHYESHRKRADEAVSLQDAMEKTLLGTLHTENDRRKAIVAALEVMARHFDAQRAYVVEFDESGDIADTPYVWCMQGYEISVIPPKDYPAKALNAFYHLFDDNGLHIIEKPSDFPEDVKRQFALDKVQSMVHYAYKREGKIAGFIGMDDCVRAHRSPTPKIIDELSGIARLLTLFVQRQPTSASAASLVTATSLLDRLADEAYIVDMSSHELVFINRRTMSHRPKARVGDLCYESLADCAEPCSQCPMDRLRSQDDGAIVAEGFEYPTLGKMEKVFASRFEMGSKTTYCLLQCVDVTGFPADHKPEGGTDEDTGIP